MTPLEQLIYNQLLIYCVSFTLTYFFVVYLNLSWWSLYAVFTIILFANQQSLLYFTPLDDVQQIIKTTSSYTIYGIAVFGLLNAFLNMGLMAGRFGWVSTIILSLLSVSTSGILGVVWAFIIHPLLIRINRHIKNE